MIVQNSTRSMPLELINRIKISVTDNKIYKIVQSILKKIKNFLSRCINFFKEKVSPSTQTVPARMVRQQPLPEEDFDLMSIIKAQNLDCTASQSTAKAPTSQYTNT